MNRWNAGLAVIVSAGLMACQQGAPQKTELEVKNQELQKRVAELEQQQGLASPSVQPQVGSSFAGNDVPAIGSAAPAYQEPVYQQAPMASAPAYEPAPEPQAARSATRSSSPRRSSSATPARRSSRSARNESTRREIVRDTEGNEPFDGPRAGAEPMSATGDPAPRRERLSLPEGTELQLVLEDGLSSETSNEGDRVVARVERATGTDGRILLPGGTVVSGRVSEARSAGRVKGRSFLAVAFDRITIRGREYDLATTSIETTGPASVKRDAAIIAGSTAAGAILGEITNRGARKGAVIGAAGGTGVVLATRGQEVSLPSGSRWTVRVTQGARID